MDPLEAFFSKLAMTQFDPISLFTEFPKLELLLAFWKWQLDYSISPLKKHSPTQEQKEVAFSCYKRPSGFDYVLSKRTLAPYNS